MANEKVLIDAQLLLEDLGEEPCIWSDTDREIQEYNDWARFKSMIERQPKVDAVEVVHAKWKYYHKQNIAVCTNCSFERNLDDDFGKAISCPNCGAKMDGDGNE